MHWVDVYAEKLLEQNKSHLIESGTSISGQPHLGSAEDIIICDGILKSIKEKGGEARAIWAMDDLDGLRKIPAQLPKDWDKYLGQPASNLPCPDGCCDSFREHFTRPFLESLERIDVRPEPVSVARMYQDGKYDKVVRTALERAQEIKDIIREISGSEREDDWLPFFPICESCGRILTTQAYEFNPQTQKVKYRCKGGIAGKNEIPGCGHEGEVGIRQGKLPWRVEWAARWSHLGVTCEPMGKDLMASGGTYETGKAICERIFGSPAPMPVPYEWIGDKDGHRLGKSVGRVVTLEELVDMSSPEIARYFFFRTNPSSHKELDLQMGIPKLAEEYELAEKVYYGIESGIPEKELEDIRRNYEISQVSGVLPNFSQVTYSHLISTIQTAKDWDHILRKLARTDDLSQMTQEHEARLKVKVEAVRNWLQMQAPDDMKFQLQEEHPDISLEPEQKEILAKLLGKLETIDWTAENIHNCIYDTSVEAGIKAGAMFKIMYQIFLDRTRGPRLGYLLASLERDFVLDRVRHFSE